MTAVRKQAFNSRSKPSQSRNSAIAAIQILWKQMRPDLVFDKEAQREERLGWITEFLGLKRELKSITALSDEQLGMIAGEMKRLTGTPQKTKGGHPRFAAGRATTPPPGGADVIHLTGEEQLYTLKKLETYIGWTSERTAEYLKTRFRCTNFQMLTFKQANSVTIQLLNIAAHKDLKAQGKMKISRAETAKYIPKLKRTLRIDQ